MNFIVDDSQPLKETTGIFLLSSAIPVKHTVVSIAIYDRMSDYLDGLRPIHQTAFSAGDVLPGETKKITASLPISATGMYAIVAKADGDRESQHEKISHAGMYSSILLRAKKGCE